MSKQKHSVLQVHFFEKKTIADLPSTILWGAIPGAGAVVESVAKLHDERHGKSKKNNSFLPDDPKQGNCKDEE